MKASTQSAPSLTSHFPSLPQRHGVEMQETGRLRSVAPAPAAAVPPPPGPSITEREKQVLLLICQGMTNVEMAARLDVARETVKSELKRIFRKLGVRNRVQAAVLMVKRGLY